MSILIVTVPEALHSQAAELAAHDGVSLERYVVQALAEKIDAAETESHNNGTRAICNDQESFAPAVVVTATGLWAGTHDHLVPYQVD